MLLFGTDFEGWYKQHAVRPDQFLFVVLVIFNPHTQTIEFAFSVAELFGGRAAPLCCGRVLRLLTFSAARLFGIAAADYVDDVNAVEPSQIAPLGLVCWKQFVGEICGFRLESSKEFIGNKGTVQGLQCDVSTSEFVTSLSKARSAPLNSRLLPRANLRTSWQALAVRCSEKSAALSLSRCICAHILPCFALTSRPPSTRASRGGSGHCRACNSRASHRPARGLSAFPSATAKLPLSSAQLFGTATRQAS